MEESDLGISKDSKNTYLSFLSSDQIISDNTLFHNNVFKQTCQRVEDRNEARVIRDITPLIVPSAEIFLYIYGDQSLNILVESTEEGWNNSMPLTGTRPQPDFSIGFRRESFTEDQLLRLSSFIGDFIAGDVSYFMATYSMYFPFLTCEVKCGATGLDVADRQNAHSMTLAVRAVVELFRAVKREKEVHQQILGFSVSHDHRSVRIYGHYPVIDEKTANTRWTAYRFTKSTYKVWMPNHFKRICSAIDQLPSDWNLDDVSLAETGLLQSFQSHHLSQPARLDSISASFDGELSDA
ncbi:unnamed protein product [Clonostachys rosea f. rosea IK726]|uniref:Uncharacterized protein n=1 Tax=Clonostachys rosea f. rosea IK726 TaxID=1349383 RepID=A0ACA9UE98_BIOOC|nr:unnamed protein product [Clonostachys rosea f. rosea IK726]